MIASTRLRRWGNRVAWEQRLEVSIAATSMSWGPCLFLVGQGTWGQCLSDWPRTPDEDVHESPGALLPVRTGGHTGDVDRRAAQIERLQISTPVTTLGCALHPRGR